MIIILAGIGIALFSALILYIKRQAKNELKYNSLKQEVKNAKETKKRIHKRNSKPISAIRKQLLKYARDK